MKTSLTELYEAHHETRRGENFVLHGDDRGPFLRDAVGTGKRVLDIGCRDGALTSFFVEGNSTVGVDIDTKALARAHDRLGIEAKVIDLNGEWGMKAGSFDAVVAAEILEHLYYPATVIGKVANVLTPVGVFAGTVPNAFSLMHRLRYLQKKKKGTPLEDPTHINHFTVLELEELLRERFSVVTVAGYGRLGWLARTFPQSFAFGLLFKASLPVDARSTIV